MKTRRRLGGLAALCVTAVATALGCGGSSVTLPADRGDAGTNGAGDAQTNDARGTSDAATGDSGSTNNTCTRTPTNHRPSGSTCPQMRAASTTMISGQGGPCSTDADCTMGKNGRCLEGPCPGSACGIQCSYDQCFSDSDCPANVPCDCRASATDLAANLCFTGSECRVDSDCGACGFCSPSLSNVCFEGLSYFCHGPADTCIDDTDCPNNLCTYDPTAKHWSCDTMMQGCPP
jgi:hypothetical protein